MICGKSIETEDSIIAVTKTWQVMRAKRKLADDA